MATTGLFFNNNIDVQVSSKRLSIKISIHLKFLKSKYPHLVFICKPLATSTIHASSVVDLVKEHRWKFKNGIAHIPALRDAAA